VDRQRSRAVRAGQQLGRLLRSPRCTLERLANAQRQLLPEDYAPRPQGEPSEALTPTELLAVYAERARLGQELFNPAGWIQQLRNSGPPDATG
jgi:hypothetical protein